MEGMERVQKANKEKRKVEEPKPEIGCGSGPDEILKLAPEPVPVFIISEILLWI